ncbi:MAG: hypothetical protein U9Q88_06920 [Bacillota bacterium]|uniref:hypothetical protein n=1 Tax=Bacillus sp. RO2 TaxID=2723913 RepID=UPI00145E1BA6|nr:hypothetical protein [Bacillus sp. RO2]MEA3319744.1 hypothetical protein [Bacillota bacterium]NMH72912.1 hypothetical protein [Bacillus sp. RO2]
MMSWINFHNYCHTTSLYQLNEAIKEDTTPSDEWRLLLIWNIYDRVPPEKIVRLPPLLLGTSYQSL